VWGVWLVGGWWGGVWGGFGGGGGWGGGFGVGFFVWWGGGGGGARLIWRQREHTDVGAPPLYALPSSFWLLSIFAHSQRQFSAPPSPNNEMHHQQGRAARRPQEAQVIAGGEHGVWGGAPTPHAREPSGVFFAPPPSAGGPHAFPLPTTIDGTRCQTPAPSFLCTAFLSSLLTTLPICSCNPRPCGYHSSFGRTAKSEKFPYRTHPA